MASGLKEKPNMGNNRASNRFSLQQQLSRKKFLNPNLLKFTVRASYTACNLPGATTVWGAQNRKHVNGQKQSLYLKQHNNPTV
ncbi:unnamed protein product [Prunus armeniaca]